MRRTCPLRHLPACAGLADPALCAPEHDAERTRRSLYLSSLAGWPATGGGGQERICPLEFPDPPPEPEPEPPTEPAEVPVLAEGVEPATPPGDFVVGPCVGC